MKLLKVICLKLILISGLASCNSSKTLTLQTSNSNCCAMIPELPINEVVSQKAVLSDPIFSPLISVMAVKKCACLENEEAKEKCFNQFKLK